MDPLKKVHHNITRKWPQTRALWGFGAVRSQSRMESRTGAEPSLRASGAWIGEKAVQGAPPQPYCATVSNRERKPAAEWACSPQASPGRGLFGQASVLGSDELFAHLLVHSVLNFCSAPPLREVLHLRLGLMVSKTECPSSPKLPVGTGKMT
jgi:hypothetical protein